MLAIHDVQIASHGGPPGIRDKSLLDSAMARPRNLALYAPATSIPHLAALYAVAISQNHPFIDGNKRVAFVAMELFLRINGFALAATDRDCYDRIISLAEGSIDERAFVSWVCDQAQPR